MAPTGSPGSSAPRPVDLDGLLGDDARGLPLPGASPLQTNMRLSGQPLQESVRKDTVVDDEQDRFDAYGQLERGVLTLCEHGIPVPGVAAKHDGVALPRLAERIAGFRLLGADGRRCSPAPSFLSAAGPSPGFARLRANPPMA